MGKFIMALTQMEVMEVQVMVTNKIIKIWIWQTVFQVQFKQEGI